MFRVWIPFETSCRLFKCMGTNPRYFWLFIYPCLCSSKHFRLLRHLSSKHPVQRISDLPTTCLLPSPTLGNQAATALPSGRHEASTPMLPHLRHTHLSQMTRPKSAYSIFLSYFSQPHAHPISLHLSSLSSFSCLPPLVFNNSWLVTLHDLFCLMVLWREGGRRREGGGGGAQDSQILNEVVARSPKVGRKLKFNLMCQCHFKMTSEGLEVSHRIST